MMRGLGGGDVLSGLRARRRTMGKLAIRGGDPVRTKPFPSWPVWGKADEQAVVQAIRTGVWGTHSDITARFEEQFAEYCGAKYGVACTNGTAALTIALQAAGVEAGAEVIVPPFTFIATAVAAVFVNATPVFVDIDPETFNLDPDAIEDAITPRTQAVIPVHFGGMPADMTAIRRIARTHKLVVIEDACHAHGSEFKGKRCGSLGDMGCFSFQSSKNLPSGEGGFITTNKAKLADMCYGVAHIGRRQRGGWYEHVTTGGNHRLSALQSALLLAQMKRLESQTVRRDANGAFLAEELAKIEGVVPQRRDRWATRVAYHVFTLRFDAERFPAPRERILEAMRAEGIPCSAGYGLPLYRQRAFLEKRFGPYAESAKKRRDVRYDKLHLPASERQCREGAWIFQSVLLGTRRDMRDIVRAFRKVRENCRELL